ncbi:MAG: glycine cleavage system aminomethyltransferase GcvT [Planctomycetota bacterium]
MLKTPFHKYHLDHGGKMVDFAGWEMPISYGSVIDEHKQVRSSGGLFDVSHMGRLKLTGRHARKLLETVCTRYVSDMEDRRCRYSLLCNEQGGTIDDVLVYRYEDHWLMVCNAANREKVVAHLAAVQAEHEFRCKVEDQTKSTAMLAIQGPKVMDVVGKFSKEVPTLKKYGFAVKNLMVLKMTISRTGYTGEDGIEIMLGASMATMAVKLLLRDESNLATIKPCGLGARDTLRVEAGMPLYGHELSEEIDPLSAGLDFAVTLDKDEREQGMAFVGQAALKQIAADGPKMKRVGLVLDTPRTARQGMKIYGGDAAVGYVTSGCKSPTLEKSIAMGYVDAETAAGGGALSVEVGSGRADGEMTALPFYAVGAATA